MFSPAYQGVDAITSERQGQSCKRDFYPARILQCELEAEEYAEIAGVGDVFCVG